MGLALASFFGGTFFVTYESMAMQTIQFRTIFWGHSSRSGFENLFVQPGVNLVVDNSFRALTVWDLVINDNGSLARFWQQAFAAYPLMPRNINFTATTVIAVFDRGAGFGYNLNVTKTESTGSRILVRVLFSQPQPSCLEPQVAQWAIHIVGIPKTRAPLTFTSQLVTRGSC